MCFIFIVVVDLEYILKFSVYQNWSSSFKKRLTMTFRPKTSSLCAFYLHCLTLIVTSFRLFMKYFFVANKTYIYCSSNNMKIIKLCL